VGLDQEFKTGIVENLDEIGHPHVFDWQYKATVCDDCVTV